MCHFEGQPVELLQNFNEPGKIALGGWGWWRGRPWLERPVSSLGTALLLIPRAKAGMSSLEADTLLSTTQPEWCPGVPITLPVLRVVSTGLSLYPGLAGLGLCLHCVSMSPGREAHAVGTWSLPEPCSCRLGTPALVRNSRRAWQEAVAEQRMAQCPTPFPQVGELFQVPGEGPCVQARGLP